MFRTALASPYPPELVVVWGQLVAEAVRLRSVARAAGQVIPMGFAAACSGFPLAEELTSNPELDLAPDVTQPFVPKLAAGSPKGYQSVSRSSG